jgi:hypothetical protein
MNTTSISSMRFLDEALTSLQDAKHFESMAHLVARIFSELHWMRNSLSTEAWKQFATIACHQHPLIAFLEGEQKT